MTTSQTASVPIRAPRDLLALVPFVLGFQPREVLVILTVNSGTGRMGPLARIDLAELFPRGSAARQLTVFDQDPIIELARALKSEDVDTAVVAIYAAEALASESERCSPSAPGRDLTRMRHDAIQVVDPLWSSLAPAGCSMSAWLVTPTGYLDLHCDDVVCCPIEGRPLDDLSTSPLGAQMVYSGFSFAASREDLARIQFVDQRERRASGQAARAWELSKVKMIAYEHGDGEGLRAWRRSSLAHWRVAIDCYRSGQGVSRSTLGRLASALDDAIVRDAIIVDLIPDGREANESDAANQALESPESVGAAMESVLRADRPVIPVPSSLAPAVSLLTDIAAGARRRHRAPALTLLSWLAWWSGEGPRAGALIDLAIEDRPEYQLAKLINTMLMHALAPGWFHDTNAQSIQQKCDGE